MWCILFDMHCRERSACSKCNAVQCFLFKSARNLVFSCWCLVSRKQEKKTTQWKHVDRDGEWRQKNANKRMFVSNKKKRCDDRMVYKCMMHNAHATRRQTSDVNDNDNDDRMAIDKTQCFSSSLFTLICIYNRNHLASPVSVVLSSSSYKKSFLFGIWFVLLAFGWFWLFICTSYRCSLFLGHAQQAHDNKKKTKNEHQIHDQNELLTSSVWMDEQSICSRFSTLWLATRTRIFIYHH